MSMIAATIQLVETREEVHFFVEQQSVPVRYVFQYHYATGVYRALDGSLVLISSLGITPQVPTQTILYTSNTLLWNLNLMMEHTATTPPYLWLKSDDIVEFLIGDDIALLSNRLAT